MGFAGLTEGGTLQKVENNSMKDKALAVTGLLGPERIDKPVVERNQALTGHVFPIPLSKRKQATIAFESLPVDKKDIAAIEGWLKLFAPSLTEEDES